MLERGEEKGDGFVWEDGVMRSAGGEEETAGEGGEQEAGEDAAAMEASRSECPRPVAGADSEGGAGEEESFVP